MAKHSERMSRAVRTTRGALGASISTVLAASAHAVAGGDISLVAVAFATIFVLPFCVALAGKVGSLWRLSLAVLGSQFFYHWTFSGIGVGSTGEFGALGAFSSGSHAAHLAALERFVPQVTEAASADAAMWILHGVGALLTIALVARGEQAVMHLARVVRRALPLPLALNTSTLFTPLLRPAAGDAPMLHGLLFARSPVTRRGPPSFA